MLEPQSLAPVTLFDRALLDLSIAANIGDEERARYALACVLADEERSQADCDMCTRKAHRAFDFRVEDGRVLYEIERHPGPSWLTHRTTTRAVDLATGKDSTVHDEIERLDVANVLTLARADVERRRLERGAIRKLAGHALGYARGLRAEVGGLDMDDFAIGWVALVIKDGSLRKAFPGIAADVSDALAELYPKCVFDAAREHFQAEAADGHARATAIWAEVTEAREPMAGAAAA